MDIQYVSELKIYRVRVNTPVRPGVADLLTDGCGNWAIDWGSEWTWGYGSEFKELEAEFQSRKNSTVPTSLSVPALPSVDSRRWTNDFKRLFSDGYWQDKNALDVLDELKDEVFLMGGDPEDAGDTGGAGIRFDLSISVERDVRFGLAKISVVFYACINWLPLGGFSLPIGSSFSGLEIRPSLHEGELEMDWIQRIYPCIEKCHRHALSRAQSVASSLSSPDGSKRLADGLAMFPPRELGNE